MMPPWTFHLRTLNTTSTNLLWLTADPANFVLLKENWDAFDYVHVGGARQKYNLKSHAIGGRKSVATYDAKTSSSVQETSATATEAQLVMICSFHSRHSTVPRVGETIDRQLVIGASTQISSVKARRDHRYRCIYLWTWPVFWLLKNVCIECYYLHSADVVIMLVLSSKQTIIGPLSYVHMASSNNWRLACKLASLKFWPFDAIIAPSLPLEVICQWLLLGAYVFRYASSLLGTSFIKCCCWCCPVRIAGNIRLNVASIDLQYHAVHCSLSVVTCPSFINDSSSPFNK